MPTLYRKPTHLPSCSDALLIYNRYPIFTFSKSRPFSNMAHLLVLVLLVTTSMAGVPTRDMGTGSDDLMNHYLADVCEEGKDWSIPELPCEIAAAIDYQCKTGLGLETYDVRPDCYDTNTCQSFDFQRTCYCKSQYLDNSLGCSACYRRHGGTMTYDWAALPSIMSDYCNPQASPTCFFEDYLSPVHSPVSSKGGDNYGGSGPSTYGLPSHTKFSDPLSDSTDVSLYFTPSKTGSDAWQTTLSAINDWSGAALQEAIAANPGTTTQSRWHRVSFWSRPAHIRHWHIPYDPHFRKHNDDHVH